MNKETLKNNVRNYIVDALFNGTPPTDFTDDTLLVSSRIMDSIVTLHMVNYFEDLLKIEFQAHEVTIENLDSVNIITNFLASKAAIVD